MLMGFSTVMGDGLGTGAIGLSVGLRYSLQPSFIA